MLQDTKSFIGGGAMATPLMPTEPTIVSHRKLTASDPYQLNWKNGGVTRSIRRQALWSGPDSILSIHQASNLGEVGAALEGHIPPHSLVLSILAGATITKILRIASLQCGAGHAQHPALVCKAVVGQPRGVSEAPPSKAIWRLGEDVSDHEDTGQATALSGTAQLRVLFMEEHAYDAGVLWVFSASPNNIRNHESSVAFAV